MMKSYFDSYIHNLKATLDEIDYEAVNRVISALLKARAEDRQIFIFGNGGSAATASHFACDLAKGTVNYEQLRFKRFRARSITDNAALLSAIGNDSSFDQIFAEQLKNDLNPGDVVIGISASGNSPNIIKAFEFARTVNARTIGLLGFTGGRARQLSDLHITISSWNYGIAEDFHLIVQHIMTQIIRRMLKGEEKQVVFLDRDGVINQKAPDHQYITHWQDFKFLPGVFDTLRYLSEMGYRLVVLTNQQGVGKGIFPESALQEIHAKMLQVLHNNGISVDKIYYCPHKAEANCGCRKPQPGLFYRAQTELDYTFKFDDSFFIGDSPTDIEAGARVGCRTIFVGDEARLNGGPRPTHRVEKLAEIVSVIRGQQKRTERLRERVKEQVALRRHRLRSPKVTTIR